MSSRSFLLIIFLTIIASSLQAATLTGRVIVKHSNEGLMNANVVVENTMFGAATDLEGRFSVSGLAAGIYTIRATSIGYADGVVADVVIYEDAVNNLTIELVSSAVKLGETVIVGQAEKGSAQRGLDERLKDNSITDNLMGEEIKKLPDPDVASLVRRTTGVAIMGGNPVIRGMGVRYSKVALNNSQVAGTEPNRSGVSLELFPASMMSKVSVNKSFLPDQYGEFGGGVVNMNTWEFPGEANWSISAGMGFSPNSTFKSFQSYSGGSLDFLGFDDGTRAMPSAIENADSKLTLKGRFSDIGYSPEELESIAESFSNNWAKKSISAAPDMNLSYSRSNSTVINDRPLGYTVSVMYKNALKFKEVERNIYKGGTNGAITDQHHYNFDYYTQSVTLGGLTAMRYDLTPVSRITFNLLINRDIDDETRLFSGYNGDRQMNIMDTRFRFVAQTTMTAQLAGQHLMKSAANSVLKWSVAGSRGIRYEPDTREVQYESNSSDDVFYFADESQSGSRIFNNLVDNSLNATLDMTTPLNDDHKLKTGLASITRRRDSETRFFQFELRDNNDVNMTLAPEEIFTAENIDMNGLMLREATRPTDSYEADHDLYAAYMMLESRLTERLRMVGGVRYENSTQTVKSYELFTATTTPVVGEISTGDFLPALNLTYMLTSSTNIRMAASQTVSRPDFRELSEFEYTDIIGGHAVIGNPTLKRAVVRHLDLRFEQTTVSGNLRAVSFFYKYFDKPIETVIQATAQNRVSYENAQSADNFGVEMELRQRLGEILPSLSNWGVSANLTLLKSDIQLSDSSKGIQTSSRRPLHGQSPYLVNLGLDYTNPSYRTQANLYFHVFGKRISEVGSKPLPDIYEMPHPDLDLTLQQPLSDSVMLKGAWKNILDTEVKYKQGDKFTERYRTGQSFSIGVSYQH